MARKWWGIDEELSAIAVIENIKAWINSHFVYILFIFSLLVCIFTLGA